MTVWMLIGGGLAIVLGLLLFRGLRIRAGAADSGGGAMDAECLALAMAAKDLRRYIGFRRMENPVFDPERGIVHYLALPDRAPAEIPVHPADCAEFAAAAGQEEAIVEFLPADRQDFESHLLILRGNRDGACWRTGLMVTLKQPRRVVDLLAKQARLVDLGRAAAAIGHEIRQPLFTIAVAAESLRILAAKAQDRDDAAQMLDRIDRIAQQVSRTQGIIENVSRYGRTDSDMARDADIVEAVRAAHGFLTPMIDDRKIDVTMTLAEGRHEVRTSRIELEQLFVNAIQNAIDAIDMRRGQGWDGAGRIDITVERDGPAVRCRVADNGVGLAPSVGISAFNAFFTTKSDTGTGLGLYISRGIVTRAGGTIALRPAGDGQGAVLEIELPVAAPAA
ncbi:hypothetical protein GCM10007897_43440 [Sphingobium jiangsuense]|uniref:histidine kinase n=1 Tax=Sphingobium jiangsuense TaxID=870476 RepID=A0A7W6BJE2_9SPHN|nr:ATP-binding protein [Sphingobium jiangsuense]MBB3927034.1 signal transduction histidine kinase [Sphingobium jiangsuense]GLT02915.1 hypothetical protein GCM10007897_43440 [Sphingobium jiangsuense]